LPFLNRRLLRRNMAELIANVPAASQEGRSALHAISPEKPHWRPRDRRLRLQDSRKVRKSG
jgi:hypothetical protein